MSIVEPYLIKTALILIPLIILLEVISLINFFRCLERPRLRSKSNNIKTTFKKTEALFQSYILITETNRKNIKLWLETENYDNSLIGQLLDYFHKIILSVALAGITVGITITVANLTFLNNSKEAKQDYYSWIKSIDTIIKSLQTGLYAFSNILFVCILIFISISIVILTRSIKEEVKHKHLKIISAVEEELKNK